MAIIAGIEYCKSNFPIGFVPNIRGEFVSDIYLISQLLSLAKVRIICLVYHELFTLHS